MCIEEVIDRAIYSRQTIEIEYCTRNGKVFSCKITNISYSNYYGGGYIVAYRTETGILSLGFSGSKLVMSLKGYIRR